MSGVKVIAIGDQLSFYCPACSANHFIKIGRNSHEWNNNIFKPSIVPICHSDDCHVLVRNGILEYMTSCNHEYAGKQIEMQAIK